MTAAAATGSGLSLLVVCIIAFVTLLVLLLVALLGPDIRARRKAKEDRLAQVHRYRLVGAFDNGVEVSEAATPGQRVLTGSALNLLERAVRMGDNRPRLLGKLERSGLRMRPEEWVAIQIAAVVIGGAGGVLILRSVLGVLFGGLGWLACQFFMSRKISRRAAAFEAQLPDALQLVAGALRSGFGLNQALGTVARDGTEPVAGEFARALQETRLGAELEDALEALAVRMNSNDMHMVVMVVRIAREIGGNLAEVLEGTVATMRARVYLRGQIRTLSAESRISAKVLIALPLLMAAYLVTVKRDYLRPMYTTTVGLVMLIGGAVLLVVGAFWLNRLTKIEV